jgi:hypothetical protein
MGGWDNFNSHSDTGAAPAADILLAPDCLLPCQFPSRESSDDPLKRLWWAVLTLGLEDYYRPSTRASAVKKATEARQWVASRSQHIGSFSWVCTMLDLSVDAMRARLLNDPTTPKLRMKRTPVNRSCRPHPGYERDRRRAAVSV